MEETTNIDHTPRVLYRAPAKRPGARDSPPPCSQKRLVRTDHDVSHSGPHMRSCGMSFIPPSRSSQVPIWGGQGVTDWISFTRSYEGPLARSLMMMQQNGGPVAAGCINLFSFSALRLATTSPAAGARAKRTQHPNQWSGFPTCTATNGRGIVPVLEML